MLGSDHKSGDGPPPQPEAGKKPIPVYVPIIAFLLLATIVTTLWLSFGRPPQTSAAATRVPPFQVGLVSIHMNHHSSTTKVYANANFTNNGDDATVTTYESFTILRSAAKGPDRDSLNNVRAWTLSRATDGTGGTTYSVRRNETKVLYFDGPLIKNAQLARFTSGKYTYYFDMLVLTSAGGNQRQSEICGYSPGNGVAYPCPPASK